MTFEWDRHKAAANFKKHRLLLEDAATVLLDPLAMTYADPDHSADERREISARNATSAEYAQHEKDASS